MLSSAIREYINKYGVTPGQNPLIFTNNDDAYRTAITMRQHNINVVAIVDIRENPDSELFRQAREMKIPVHVGSAVVTTRGYSRIKSATIMKLSSDGKTLTGGRKVLACDCLAMSGGWNPAIHLFSQSGGRVKWNDELATFIPSEATQNVLAIGGCNGAADLAK